MRLTFWRPDVPDIYKYSVRTSQGIHCASIKKTNRWMLYKKDYRCLLIEPYGTRKYTVWAKCRVFYCQTCSSLLSMGSDEIKVIKDCWHCRGHIDDLALQMGFSLFHRWLNYPYFIVWTFGRRLFAGAFVLFKWANVKVKVVKKYRLCVLWFTNINL